MKYLFNSLIVLNLIWLTACSGGTDPKPDPEPPANVSPNAFAPNDFSAEENTQVTLDASKSTDSDGTIVSYSWSQTSGSPDVALSNTSTANASFTAPDISSETQLTFEVTVTDNDGATDSDSLTITITPTVPCNLLPIAHAGIDQQVNTSSGTVTLDASQSSDPEGGALTYQWQQIAGSPIVTLNNSSLAVADFSAPSVTQDSPLTFELTVTDNQGLTATDSVIVTITDSITTNPITAVLETSRTTCTAPCGIMFNASATTSNGVNEPFHELHYNWNYGDAGSTFQQRPGVDANKSTAPIGSHVYEHPGTYTTTLTVTGDDGGTDTKTINIIVDDPDVIFAAETYCVSTSNNFVACPTQDANFHFTSFSSAATFIRNLRFNQNSKPTRLLLRASETFTATNRINIRDLTASFHISSFDSGENAIIKLDPTMIDETLFFIHDSSDITFHKLNFSGSYDPVTGLGNHIMSIWFYLAVTDALVYQNDFSGIDMAVYAHGGSNMTTGAPSQYQMIVDNNITNWQDYGIFGTFGYLGTLLANNLKQDPNAVSGSEAKCGTCIPNFADHGPLRAGYSDHLLIQYNDMFNNAGWSSGGLAHQPNIRLGTGGSSKKSIISDNVLNGGFTMISMTPANPDPASAAVMADVIIERNKMTATSNTWQMIDMGLGGATIRNNLFIKPDNAGPPIGSGSFETPIVFKVEDIRTTAGSLALTNRIYNNTLISLAQTSASSVTLVEVENNFTEFEIHNNIVYAPFINANGEAGVLSWMYAGSMANVKMDNNLLFAPNTSNFVWNNGVSMDLATWQGTGNGISSLVMDPLLTDPNNFDATLIANSPAIDNGVSKAGLRSDIDDKNRDSNVDIGAYEF